MSIETSASLFDPNISPELRAIYEKIIKDGNPTSSSEIHTSSNEDPSTLDTFIYRQRDSAEINMLALFNTFGSVIVDAVDKATEAYYEIQRYKSDLEEGLLSNQNKLYVQGMLNTQRELFDGSVNVASSVIDIPALIRRQELQQEEIDLNLQINPLE